MEYHGETAPRDIVRGGQESYNAYDGRYDVDDSSVRTAKFYIPEDDHEDVFRASAVAMAQTASNGGCGAGWSSPGRAYPYVNTEQVQPIAYGRDASGYSSRASSIGWAEHEPYPTSREWQGRQDRGFDGWNGNRSYHEGTPEPYGQDTRYDHAYGAVGGQRRSKGYEMPEDNAASRPQAYHAQQHLQGPPHQSSSSYAFDAYTVAAPPAQPATYDGYPQYARQPSPRQVHQPSVADQVEYQPTESPIKPPLNPSPEEALAQSGVNLSNWIAEATWNMLLHPYYPGKPTDDRAPGLRRSRNDSQDGFLPTPPNAYARFSEHPGGLGYKKNSADDLAYYSLDASHGLKPDLSPYYRLSLRPQDHPPSGYGSPVHVSPPLTPHRHDLSENPYRLRSHAPQTFANFIYRTLSQTLLSPAAVVLAVWYMRRLAVHIGGGEDGLILRQMLHEAAERPDGKGGEEVARRLVVLGLACSNKWLDDNTFTNKSWSDVTHLPLLELNRLEMLALSPSDINFDLSVSQLEWQLWVEEVERTTATPFVTDARLVRDVIHTLFYPALDQSRRRFVAEVESRRMRVEERAREAERQRLERMEVERMLAVADEQRRQSDIALLDQIARQAIWEKQQQQQMQQAFYQPARFDAMPSYYDDQADNGGWGRDFAPSGARGERFGSTGSNASSGYGSARSSGTPYVPNTRIASALAAQPRTTGRFAPPPQAYEQEQVPYQTYHSDPWGYRQQPAAAWRDTRRGLIAA